MKTNLKNIFIFALCSLSLLSCGDPTKEESTSLKEQEQNVNFYNLNVDEMNKITPKFHAYGFQLRATSHAYANFEIKDIHALPFNKCSELRNLLSQFIHHGNQAIAGAEKEGKTHTNHDRVRGVYNATKEAEFYFAQIDCNYELSIVEAEAEAIKLKSFKNIEFTLMLNSDFQFQNIDTDKVDIVFFDQSKFTTESDIKNQLSAIETFLFDAKALGLAGYGLIDKKIDEATDMQTQLLGLLANF